MSGWNGGSFGNKVTAAVEGIKDIVQALINIQKGLSSIYTQIEFVTVASQWNAGQVNALGTGLSLSGTTLTPQWEAGTVTSLASGLSISANVLTPQWRAGSVTSLGAGLSLVAGTLNTVAATPPATVQATPANPTGTTSTTGVMMGLAVAFTPAVSGNALIVIGGSANSSAIGDGARAQIRYGTGAAPTNGAALTGTTAGSSPRYVASTIAGIVPFSLNAVVTGLTVSTPIWVDVGLAAITAGTATIADLSVSVVEIT